MDTFTLPDSFYVDLGNQTYQPSEATIGPWSSAAQHGGPPIALIAHALRTFPSPHNLTISRISAEILGPIPVETCEIEMAVIRPGKRIELLQAQMTCQGKPVLIATAWRLAQQPGCVEPVPDDFNVPELPAPQEQVFFPGIDYFPYAHALEWRFAQGHFSQHGPATVWTRPRIELIKGQANHGLDALLLMLDSANGISAELDLKHWSFVPVDLTLNMHRHPQGEWVGMAAKTIIDSSGIGSANTRMFDAQGAFGRSLHTLFVRPHR